MRAWPSGWQMACVMTAIMMQAPNVPAQPPITAAAFTPDGKQSSSLRSANFVN